MNGDAVDSEQAESPAASSGQASPVTAPAAPTAGKPWWRSKGARAVIFAVAGLALFGVLLSRVSLEVMLDAFRRTDPLLLAAAVLVGMTPSVIKAVRFGVFFPPGKRWLALYGVHAVARVLALAMPFRTGELAIVGMLKRHRLVATVAELAPAWALTKVLDLMVVAAFLGVAAVASGPILADHIPVWPIIAVAVAGGLGVIIAGAVAMRLPPPAGEGWLAGRLRTMHRAIDRLRSPRRLTAAALLSVGAWGGMIATSVIYQHAFGTPLPLSATMLASVVVVASWMLPIHPPLGLGTADAIWVGAMVMLGVDQPAAIALAVCFRCTSILILLVESLLGAAILYSQPAPPAA